MDLNQLYHDHQLSLMQAAAALCGASRLRYRNHASDIARSITRLHRSSGATALHGWERTLAA
jgi:hypothetical protein